MKLIGWASKLGGVVGGIALVLSLVFFPKQAEAANEKVIRVNLNQQVLTAEEDGTVVYRFPVSTGKRVTPTPTGGFWPWIKLRFDGMSGGSRAGGDYYNLPKVPYVVYFYNENYPKNRGYALHGTYWHNNFGTPMSHGCVNLRTADMAQLYPWVELPSETGKGTLIVVEGATP